MFAKSERADRRSGVERATLDFIMAFLHQWQRRADRLSQRSVLSFLFRSVKETPSFKRTKGGAQRLAGEECRLMLGQTHSSRDVCAVLCGRDI
ncbi:hypothetical protein GTNG_0208 [Geobacillus thermodenitrificans NG80-2]|uniref:Uncharacterized protein n=1 Tax=Geobacillus thermodenitrificans (strain NG80-2) TaxID=420246 RepID=A4IJT8_GEOTN|nr:hypothetical protein GTNG_0208 [Geobacillus thermodenitrificans NG80-2]